MAEKIKILAVSYAFVPWVAPRSLQAFRLMNYLCNNNCEITLIQKKYQNLNVPIDQSLLSVLDAKIKTIEVDEYNGSMKKVLKKLFNRFNRIPDDANLWAFNVFSKIRKYICEYDLIITFSTPVSDHITGLLVKMFFRDIPWIVFFSDPYVDNPYIKRNNFEKFINNKIEKKIIRNSQALIFVNDATRQFTMGKYPALFNKKAYVIPHSFDEKSYPVELNENKKFIMRYIGDFYGNRSPEGLFRAMRLISDQILDCDKSIELQIFGNNNSDINNLIEKFNLKRIVKYKGHVGYLDSLELMSSADLLVVIDAPAELNLFLTSKVIDYIGAKTRILAITPANGPTYELMNEIGWNSFSHEDVIGISDQIIKFLNQKKRKKVSGSIEESIYNRYKIETVGKQYLDLIKTFIRVNNEYSES